MKRYGFFATLVVIVGAALASTFAQGTDRVTTAALKDFSLRNIGPMLTTGRVQDTTVDPKDNAVISPRNGMARCSVQVYPPSFVLNKSPLIEWVLVVYEPFGCEMQHSSSCIDRLRCPSGEALEETTGHLL